MIHLLYFIFGFLLVPSKGKIFPPPGGPELTFLPGTDAKIRWSFDDTPSSGSIRAWYFITDDGSPQLLGQISGVGKTADNVSPGFAIEQGAILVIKNFNESRNGKYQFAFLPNPSSDVFVSVITKPTVRLTCLSSVLLKEGENFTCTCLAENGNPAPNLTWHKDKKRIGGIGKNNKTLELNNVNPQNDGTYTCKAESYPDPKFIDQKLTQLTVKPFSKPSGTEITFTPPSPAVIDSEVTVKCTSDGHPEPSYTIFHNGKEISSKSSWKISPVKSSDAGTYECFVKNRLGNDSQSKNLTVKERSTTTKPSTMPSTRATSSGDGTAKTDDHEDSKLGVGEIVGIVIGVLMFIIIIAGVVYYFFCRSGENDGYRGKRDVSPGGKNDNQYEMGDNEYDTVKPGDGGEGSGEKPKKKNQPPVYAQVDKENRQGKPLYATLDTVALDSGGSKKRDEGRTQPTEYAAIDHSRTGDVPRADLV